MLLLKSENPPFGVNTPNAALAVGAALGLGLHPQAGSQLSSQLSPSRVSV